MEFKLQSIEENIQFLDFRLSSELSKKMIETSKKATKSSYSPYSNFRVGSAVLLENDDILPGTL